MSKFYLPVMQKLIIQNYSLYECPVNIDFSSKLNIIYGTNGTGKSTLLMMILFAIVGPYRGGIKTKVRQEQRRDNRPIYDESFFSARMSTFEIEPSVTAVFSIHQDKYIVKHSLQDGKLLEASVNENALSGKVVSYRTYEEKYTKQRSDLLLSDVLQEYLIYHYQEQLKKSTCLPGGINTLISMLLDVMFFDEGRKLTFWNTDLQETIIGKYIVDADFYEKYCEKKLDTKALESTYKKKSETLNYMSKFFEREKKEKGVVGNKNDEQLQIELTNLESDIEKYEIKLKNDQLLYKRKNNELLANIRLIEKLKEKFSYLENTWYSSLFPSQYQKYYSRFSNIMAEGVCPVCGNKHSFKLESTRCLLCGEKLELKRTVDLVHLDTERRKSSEALIKEKRNIEQLQSELSSVRVRIDKNRKVINTSNVRVNEIKALLKTDEDYTETSDKKRLEKAREERNVALENYKESKSIEDEMHKKIEESFEEKFLLFKNTFIRFSSSFFGDNHTEDLSLPFNDETASSPLMRFELDGKPREEEYMLSESQRIFTDLAFRFSVLTTFHDKSFFICETPDSTLDIFHEEQAVKTFLEYINQGNAVILSANARHSDLIYKLFNSFKENEVTVIDLTQISKLSLVNNFSFKTYMEER